MSKVMKSKERGHKLCAPDEMVEGYIDGLNDDRADLPENGNRTQQYVHGWYNGRDDRIKKPRDSYNSLVATANKIISEDL